MYKEKNLNNQIELFIKTARSYKSTAEDERCWRLQQKDRNCFNKFTRRNFIAAERAEIIF